MRAVEDFLLSSPELRDINAGVTELGVACRLRNEGPFVSLNKRKVTGMQTLTKPWGNNTRKHH